MKSNIKLWERQAQKLSWFKPWDKVLEWNEPYAQWFKGGLINASYQCLDIHMSSDRKDKIALYWECENGQTQLLTYAQLYALVNRYAGAFRELGVKKGDVVVLYLPMTPQAVATMLACARLGATHSVVFSGFSAHALAERIQDTQARFVVTSEYTLRRGKKIDLRTTVRSAVKQCPSIEKTILVNRPDQRVQDDGGSEVCLDEVAQGHAADLPAEHVESTHPLFILYTSGTTGKPKGIIQSTAGYLTYIYSTIKWGFDITDKSIYWCTADIGWITGHSYVVYGPLMHGAAVLIHEGAPDYPNASVWWSLIEKYKVDIFYTSPTALRMCKRFGDSWIEKHDLSSLKVLGSVGEPINPEVWSWYNNVIGKKKCPIIDTWWQTETGGFMISPALGKDLVALKPGSATMPLPGIQAEVVDEHGQCVPAGVKGYLVIKNPWPGMSIGVYNDPGRFKQVYWSKFPGCYYPGDYAIKDRDGYFWLLGRADEVLNVAGHRIGTAEIESAVVSCPDIVEAAVIGTKDDIKGEQIVIFAIAAKGVEESQDLKNEIIQTVREQIGSFAKPSGIYFVQELPKTRSGKIMRRLIKAVVLGGALGDVTTLEDGASMEEVKSAYQSLAGVISAG